MVPPLRRKRSNHAPAGTAPAATAGRAASSCISRTRCVERAGLRMGPLRMWGRGGDWMAAGVRPDLPSPPVRRPALLLPGPRPRRGVPQQRLPPGQPPRGDSILSGFNDAPDPPRRCRVLRWLSRRADATSLQPRCTVDRGARRPRPLARSRTSLRQTARRRRRPLHPPPRCRDGRLGRPRHRPGEAAPGATAEARDEKGGSHGALAVGEVIWTSWWPSLTAAGSTPKAVRSGTISAGSRRRLCVGRSRPTTPERPRWFWGVAAPAPRTPGHGVARAGHRDGDATVEYNAGQDSGQHGSRSRRPAPASESKKRSAGSKSATRGWCSSSSSATGVSRLLMQCLEEVKPYPEPRPPRA